MARRSRHDRREDGAAMLRLLLAMRFVMLLASFGAVLGALLMFAIGGAELAAAVSLVAAGEEGAKAVTATVLGATDALLFGIVLVIFAYAIAFGFVFEISERARARVPAWMRLEGVSELKHTLVEVILVYLIVDFATDVAKSEAHLSWQTLVKPLAILAIAAALRLLSGGRPAAEEKP
jgi:uncharacterized membrane protein YqhA